MTKHIRNQERAEAASLALDTYCRAKGISGVSATLSSNEAMIDLLTDLRHLAALHEVDFARVIRISEFHFDEEADGAVPQLTEQKG